MITIPGKTKALLCSPKSGSFLCTHADTLAYPELKCHYLAGTEELNKTEETEKRRKRETKMVLNAFIIQMNENHINESRHCTSVWKSVNNYKRKLMKSGALCGKSSQPSKRLLIPFGGKTSEGSLV